MTSLATIVFKSGATVDFEIPAAKATEILDYFGANWDVVEPELTITATESGSNCRVVPSEIVGIFINGGVDDGHDVEDEDEEEEEEEEDDDDSEDGEDEDAAEEAGQVD